jgi:hypothetical protein
LNEVVLALTETNVGLSYDSGYLGIERQVGVPQAEEAMKRSADAVSTASRKAIPPALI